jgi:hypothetical protein
MQSYSNLVSLTLLALLAGAPKLAQGQTVATGDSHTAVVTPDGRVWT